MTQWVITRAVCTLEVQFGLLCRYMELAVERRNTVPVGLYEFEMKRQMTQSGDGEIIDIYRFIDDESFDLLSVVKDERSLRICLPDLETEWEVGFYWDPDDQECAFLVEGRHLDANGLSRFILEPFFFPEKIA